MTATRAEVLAWLGDAADDMTTDQIVDLTRHADDVDERYPDPDDQADRDAALTAAHQLITGHDPVDDLSRRLLRARMDEAAALAGIRQAAHMLVDSGQESLRGFSRRAGVDPMAVSDWLGRRNT